MFLTLQFQGLVAMTYILASNMPKSQKSRKTLQDKYLSLLISH